MSVIVKAPQLVWQTVRRAGRAARGSFLLAGAVAACGHFMTDAPVSATTVASVVPAGGATAVSTTSPIVITFSHAMPMGAEMKISLREGSVTGPEVPGSSTWSADRTTLTFTPQAPLKALSTYVLRIGGGMMDADDRPMNYEGCRSWGGQSVPGGGMAFTFTTA